MAKDDTEKFQSQVQAATAKRHSRITDGRLAVRQADAYIRSYPQAAATPVVRNIKLALDGLLSEIEGI